MFADVEILSNNTYKFNKFTYSIPTRLTQKIKIGSIIKVTFRNNIKDAILHLSSLEIDIISLSEKGEDTIYSSNFKKSVAIIMGSEERGISKSILNLSNKILKVPISSKIDSLNVSVAFSAVVFEIIRQRNF